MGNTYKDLNFDEILMTGYSVNKAKDKYLYSFQMNVGQVIAQTGDGYSTLATCKNYEKYDSTVTCNTFSQI
jgi:hypothetical protein